MKLVERDHLFADTSPTATALVAEFQRIRAQTMMIAAPLSVEDCQVQSMADASSIKWHLAHVTWFFETFILSEFALRYTPFDPQFKVLFNSYYNAVGAKHPRPERGLITRPALDRVLAYRAHVDAAIVALIDAEPGIITPTLVKLLLLGFNHEQQHQELMLTDVKHLLSMNPVAPKYSANAMHPKPDDSTDLRWSTFSGGLVEIGRDAEASGFGFDNESPRHRVYLQAFEFANRLVTNREYLSFVGDGGYTRHELWLSDGFDQVQRDQWQAPLYWRANDSGSWQEFTLSGLQALELDAPVCHVSFFEADAYARWAQARLPTESEWEHVATSAEAAPQQLHDHAWQWTASSYLGYPGFKTAPGAVGEYNGKFICNQFVLRGSSCATPKGHARATESTYRNFFQPEKRWQFTGIRLAR
jgi:ergothioneine biosynthesis protein EgtB